MWDEDIRRGCGKARGKDNRVNERREGELKIGA